jgi:hypothetical protein
MRTRRCRRCTCTRRSATQPARPALAGASFQLTTDVVSALFDPYNWCVDKEGDGSHHHH